MNSIKSDTENVKSTLKTNFDKGENKSKTNLDREEKKPKMNLIQNSNLDLEEKMNKILESLKQFNSDKEEIKLKMSTILEILKNYDVRKRLRIERKQNLKE